MRRRGTATDFRSAPTVPLLDEASVQGVSVFELTRTSIARRLAGCMRHAGDPRLARSLESIDHAIRVDDVDSALRRVDRAWRSFPAAVDMLASIYGRILLLHGTDFNATLGLLKNALESTPDPDDAALLVYASLRLCRIDDARRHLGEALARYCVEPDGLLAAVARDSLQPGAVAAPGWIGREKDLSFVGDVGPDEPNVLQISIEGGSPFTQLLNTDGESGLRRFHFAHAQIGAGSRLTVSSRGLPLIGSDAAMNLDFLLDGRVEIRGNRIRGWARLGWLPATPVDLRIEDDKGRPVACRSAGRALPGWRWPFTLDLQAARLYGSHIEISARLPDGSWQLLPDAPFLRDSALYRRLPAPLGKWRKQPLTRRTAAAKRAKMIDVIIPVYGAFAETLACIDSVLATLGADARLVVVDDASEDPRLSEALDALAAAGLIHLLRNARNLGFVGSVNRGLRLHATHDALLLNSDTQVFDDWLPRLRAAAYSGPRVGTVTPLTNSGSIASYPGTGGAMEAPAAAALQRLAASALAETRVEIPVGVGFCLYIRRDCLRATGGLDAAVFGKGYGEEVDFCLRARAKGWSHLLAADVFVLHAGGLSFAGRRQALLDRSQRLLNRKYPGYDRFIAGFLAADPLHLVRRRLDEQRLSAFEGRFVLVVTLALLGGVDRYVTERGRSIKSKGLHPLLLRPTTAGKPARCELWTDALDLPNLQYGIPLELAALQSLLQSLNVDSVEIQHFLGLDPRVIEAVRALPMGYDVMIHDYSWICPRVTLIDGTKRYCGEPDVSACEICIRRNGSHLTEKISVAALRARSIIWLGGARQVLAPSYDAATRLQGYMNDLTIDVRPHTATIRPTPLARRPSRRPELRVALIGGIGTHKGYRILLECARDARTRRLPIEFIVIGHSENDAPLLATGKVFITGQYNEQEAVHLLQREQPDIAWLPSVWPETWSYALDYALGAGLPVAAFDIGAIAERLRAGGAGGAGGGELMPLGCPAPQINDRLLAMDSGREREHFTTAEDSQSVVPRPADELKMKRNPTDGISMTKATNGTASRAVKDEGLSASVQVLPLPPGLYLFSVKSASPPQSAQGQLSLPAMHIGLGPGTKSAEVEFMSGPSTHGAWLFSTNDLLVTRIIGPGATLIATSVRAPGGETLSIKVERLEDRSEASAPATLPVAAQSGAAAKSGPSADTPLFDATGGALPLPVHIVAHIRTRGDMDFAHVPWAGRVAPGLWIESFSVQPLDHFGARDIEYKGLTGSGFETPWITDNQMCGTKGMATPLVGFAIRLKPSPAAASFDCEYSGYFQSGIVVGPMRNGAPCRSTVASDALEGVQVRIVKRAATTAITDVNRAAPPAPPLKPVRKAALATRLKSVLRARPVKKPPTHFKKAAARRQPSRRP